MFGVFFPLYFGPLKNSFKILSRVDLYFIKKKGHVWSLL